MESIANAQEPRSPVLGVKFPVTLQRKYVGEDFLTSRVNCVVQASGVDFLHLMLTALEYLCSEHNVKARFMISIHDEIRYICPEADCYKLAYCFQIAHIWTRAFICHKWGFSSIPNSVAWFSQVDIDHCLRKEPTACQKTLTNDIEEPDGEGLEMQQILDKLNIPYQVE
jgi:DNA polymerase gamma 1